MLKIKNKLGWGAALLGAAGMWFGITMTAQNSSYAHDVAVSTPEVRELAENAQSISQIERELKKARFDEEKRSELEEELDLLKEEQLYLEAEPGVIEAVESYESYRANAAGWGVFASASCALGILLGLYSIKRKK